MALELPHIPAVAESSNPINLSDPSGLCQANDIVNMLPNTCLLADDSPPIVITGMRCRGVWIGDFCFNQDETFANLERLVGRWFPELINGGGSGVGANTTPAPPRSDGGQRECSAFERALQEWGQEASAIGTDVATVGINVSAVGGGIVLGGVLTGDFPIAAAGAQVFGVGGELVVGGGAIATGGALMQAIGGRPNEAIVGWLSDRLTRNLPIGEAGRAVVQRYLEDAAEALPQLNTCQ